MFYSYKIKTEKKEEIDWNLMEQNDQHMVKEKIFQTMLESTGWEQKKAERKKSLETEENR
ncbi:MAG: hypothetical protein OSJ62_13020 [Lachnospiraceae bacterium]|nr:hypothetical protein [Lachnospiraceae bacterium]